MSAEILDFAARVHAPTITPADGPIQAPDRVADVQEIAARLRRVYVQAFDDTLRTAVRWASTGERHPTEENSPCFRARNVLERILAEGQLARLQRHAEHFAPESRARQLQRVRQVIHSCDSLEESHVSRGGA